ncbi:MAG: hypothetical protein CV082_13980 [Candidatus Brocadia sp. BL1]|nr:MAG: hypothetical protein CV082_13980 [Candidatus Brocadia sp. BL1]
MNDIDLIGAGFKLAPTLHGTPYFFGNFKRTIVTNSQSMHLLSLQAVSKAISSMNVSKYESDTQCISCVRQEKNICCLVTHSPDPLFRGESKSPLWKE